MGAVRTKGPSATVAVPDGEPPEARRRPELDALRLFVIFGLIPIHAAQIFASFFGFWVKDDPSYAFSMFVTLAAFWAMPMLFLTSGMTMWYALRKRSAGQFVRERVRRLLVPFLFGMVAVIPFLVFVEKVREGYDWSYWTFLGRFFDVRFAWDLPYFVDATDEEFFETGHLYFLYYLFVYSLVLLPLFAYLRSERGSGLKSVITRQLVRPGVLAVMVVPIALLQGLHEVESSGGWSRWVYLVLVLYGCLFSLDQRIMRTVAARWRSWLSIAGVVTIGLISFGTYLDGLELDAFHGRELLPMLWRVGMGLSGWFSVLAILGGTARALSGSRAVEDVARSREQSRLARLGAYAQDAVLPVYILHMAAIVGIGYVVVQWSGPTIVKYLVIVVASFVATILLFELVRRNRITRFLLGIKAREEGFSKRRVESAEHPCHTEMRVRTGQVRRPHEREQLSGAVSRPSSGRGSNDPGRASHAPSRWSRR